MSNLTIKINTENDAFANYPENEVSRILRKIADGIEAASLAEYRTNSPVKIYDINGNNIGRIVYE